jgi:hypothetical protein
MIQSVRPTDYEIARDRMRRLGILTFALARHTSNFRDVFKQQEYVTLGMLVRRLKTQQRAWWTREIAKFRSASRGSARTS